MSWKQGVVAVIVVLLGVALDQVGGQGDGVVPISDWDEVAIEDVETTEGGHKLSGSLLTSEKRVKVIRELNEKYLKEEEQDEEVNKGGEEETTGTKGLTAVATVYPDLRGTLAKNVTGSVVNGTSHNITTTTPSRYQRVKVACLQLFPEGANLTAEEAGAMVEIVNMTYLLQGLLITNPTIKARSTPSNCTVVLFYTHWCPWSAKAAPHFNALPRAFRNIRFAAIDSSVYTAINTYFGILSVPSVVLFYNGKILAKFNDTTFNVNQFADFISTFTDQKPGIRLNVTSTDFVGPIPATVTKGHDWYLYLSWTFIIACFVYYISKTTIWHRILDFVKNSWTEAEAVASVLPSNSQHQHLHQD